MCLHITHYHKVLEIAHIFSIRRNIFTFVARLDLSMWQDVGAQAVRNVELRDLLQELDVTEFILENAIHDLGDAKEASPAMRHIKAVERDIKSLETRIHALSRMNTSQPV